MIHHLFTFLRDELNAYFNRRLSVSVNTMAFHDGENDDPLGFELDKITPFLINIQEEKVLRPADRYSRKDNSGKKSFNPPFIPIHVYILFISRFKNYEEGLKRISMVMQFFQSRPSIGKQEYPSLPDSLYKITPELVTLSFQQQNELWSSLKTAYHPSLLYKMSLMVIEEETSMISSKVGQLDRNLRQQ
ncbi:MAG: DUF4255 domain-containing protein [Bacteroidota bacterium]